jgi:hypothetical protein
MPMRSAAVASPRATNVSMTSSRRALRARSTIAAHARSQVLQRAELELLHGALRAPQRGRHVVDALDGDVAIEARTRWL